MLAVAVVGLPLPAIAEAAGTITTFAGTGAAGATGDGGPAAGATLDRPAGVAVDAAGNVYVSDAGNNRVRKIDSIGTITTFAGTGAAGGAGDGGPAAEAGLDFPTDVVVDASGNVFIADHGNHRVRRVAGDGTITTVAGTGADGYSGDGGPAMAALLSGPVGLDLDAGGNLFIADYDNDTVRKVTPAGVISTVAGTGKPGFTGDGGRATSARLDSPADVVADAGVLYVADSGNSRVRRVDAAGTITTFAGTGVAGSAGDGGPAAAATLAWPVGLAVDSSGNVFIADFSANVIRKVDASGVITTVAGTGTAGAAGDGGPATAAELDGPARVNTDTAGNFYVSDLNNDRVRRVDALAAPSAVPGAPTGVTAAAGLGQADVAWDPPSSDGGSPITSYTVTSSGGDAVTVDGSTLSATVGGLTNGMAYTFTVVATNAVGDSTASAPSAPVTPVGPPAPPTLATASVGDGEATVTWNPPAFDGGSPVTSYTLRSSGGEAVTVDGSTLSATVGGLTNGTAYTFTVVATNAYGDSPPSGPSTALTPSANDSGSTGTGSTGATGPTGTVGTTGTDGAADLSGTGGTTDPTGTGSTATTGLTGTTDMAGATEPTDTSGATGATDLTGATAPSGTTNTPGAAKLTSATVTAGTRPARHAATPSTTPLHTNPTPSAGSTPTPAQALPAAEPAAPPPGRPTTSTRPPRTNDHHNGSQRLDDLLAHVGRAGVTVSEASAASFLLYLVVIGFLAIQDRIDRNDPKLALAPVYGEPDLPFLPAPLRGDASL